MKFDLLKAVKAYFDFLRPLFSETRPRVRLNDNAWLRDLLVNHVDLVKYSKQTPWSVKRLVRSLLKLTINKSSSLRIFL